MPAVGQGAPVTVPPASAPTAGTGAAPGSASAATTVTAPAVGAVAPLICDDPGVQLALGLMKPEYAALIRGSLQDPEYAATVYQYMRALE